MRIRLNREVDRYNWQRSNADVLKEVYHQFIPRDIRHDFGEYYTPDWLAEAICEHVLDDVWCREAVKRAADLNDDLEGIGVLEPSCGSGTFLRAAINRLLPFAQKVTEDGVQQSNILCRLVHGLDIHPVAVELARATMLSALPAVPSEGEAALQVFLGDTLRWNETTDLRLFAGEGLLIETPADANENKRMLVIPRQALLYRNFSEVVDDMVKNSDRISVLEVRFRQHSFSDETVSELLKCASIIDELKREGRNHIWSWYIKNIAQPYRLAHRKLDRMVGNPPWITQSDLRGDRQEIHRRESNRTLIWVGGKQAPHNDLAALFVSSSARNYMSRKRQWRMGMVLPYSALRSGQWERFRSGRWHRMEDQGTSDDFNVDLSEMPWSFKELDERPFQQSDSCVMFGCRSTGSAHSLSHIFELWSGTNLERRMSWSEISERVNRDPFRNILTLASDYLHSARQGAVFSPVSLVLIEKGSLQSGGAGMLRFKTRKSRHTPWKGNEQHGIVEQECVRRVVLAADIAPHRVFGESHAVTPTDEVFQSEDPYLEIARRRRFDNYWARVDNVWKKHRKPKSAETLLLSLDHMRKLSTQILKPHSMRVIYPRSGANFFAAYLDASIVVDTSCYYIPVRHKAEARYLCAIFSAEALNYAFRMSRRSDRDFHTYPLRTVPVPEFDATNQLHAELAALGERAELVAAAVPLYGGATKMRRAIRDALLEDGISDEIDECVRELLPGYAA